MRYSIRGSRRCSKGREKVRISAMWWKQYSTDYRDECRRSRLPECIMPPNKVTSDETCNYSRAKLDKPEKEENLL
jgi:hypothetical protein